MESLSVPGRGIHAHRTLGLATVDLAATVLASGFAALIASRGKRVDQFATTFLSFLACAIVLGVCTHFVLGIPTELNVRLGLAMSDREDAEIQA